MKQKVLVMSTNGPDMRSTAQGWTCEDGAIVRAGDIGMTGAPYPYPSPATPLHALGDGWCLLAPPAQIGRKAKALPRGEWEWWFTMGGERP